MADSRPPRSSSDTSLQRTVSDLPSPTSEQSYFSQVRKYANDETREYLWRDLAIEAVAASLYGFRYGWTISGLVHGVLAFGVLFVAAYLIHLGHAPRALDRRLRERLKSTQQLLEDEKAKNAEPKLGGRVDCLDHDINWDTENYGLDEAMPLKLKVTFALNVTLWNETLTATTVSDFSLWLTWKGGQFQADKLPVEDNSVERSFPRSDHEWGYETKQERLIAFPFSVEITNENLKADGLGFWRDTFLRRPVTTPFFVETLLWNSTHMTEKASDTRFMRARGTYHRAARLNERLSLNGSV